MASSESLDIIVKMKDLASNQAKSLGATLKSVAQSSAQAFTQTYKAIFNLPNALAAVSASVAVQKLREGLDLTADLESIKNGFDNLSRSLGGATNVLGALRSGTRDTVSDFKLMEVANKAMLLGVGRSAAEFEELANLSRRLGRAVGRDATEAFSDLTIGIGRQSRLILDNLGIVVPVEQAYKSFAKSLGVTVESLTEVQKRVAFNNAVFAESRRMLREMGPDVWTFADAYGQLGSILRNLRDDVLRSLTPLFQELVQSAADFVKSNKGELFLFLAKMVDTAKEFVVWLEAVGKALQVLAKVAYGSSQVIGFAVSNVGAYVSEWVTIFKQVPGEVEKLKSRWTRLWHDVFGTLNAPWEWEDDDAGVPDIASRIADQAKKVQIEATGLMGALDKVQAQLLEHAKSSAAGASSYSWDVIHWGDAEDAAQADRILKSQMAEFASIQELGQAYEKLNKLRSEIYLTQPPPDELAMIRRAEQEYDANLKLQELYDEMWLKERLAMRDGQAELDEAAAKRRLEAQEVARENQENLTLLGGMKAAFNEMADTARQFGKEMKSAILESTDALVSGLADALFDTISLTKDAGEAFAEMGKKVSEMIGKIFLEMALRTAIGGLFGAFGAGAAAEVPFSMSMYGAADGGVFGGHFRKVKGHFARGDVARERGLYELREAGQDEAVIPLVGNRYVPVKLMSTQAGGGSSGTVIQNTFNFYGDSRQFARQLRENADTVAAIIAQKQNSSMKFREGMAA